MKKKKPLIERVTQHVVAERLDVSNHADSVKTASRGQYWYSNAQDLSYCVLEPGDLSVVPRLKAIWQYDTGSERLILSCPNCGALNDATDWNVYRGGYIGRECVTCTVCGLHYWCYLRGWNKLSAKIRDKFKEA